MSEAQRRLHGARRRSRTSAGSVASSETVITTSCAVSMPETLTPAERAVWRALESEAVRELTLTRGTAGDFAALCQLEVEMAECLAERRKEGWTARGLFLAKEYRGLVQRVEAKRRAFRLAPMGKPMAAPEQQPVDEWAEFDTPTLALVKR